VVDGKVHVGKTFASGEFSSIRTNGDDGNDFSGIWAVRNGIRGLLTSVQNALNTDDLLTGHEIFEMANNGHELVLKGLDEFCNRLAIQIYNLQTFFDPQVIAIGGGISAQPLLFELTEKHIEDMYQKALKANSPINRPNIKVCVFKNDANLIGALYQLFSTMKTLQTT
jgi:predicted NBD/HSP70 family sugar kinase